jgi:hypothetical protein
LCWGTVLVAVWSPGRADGELDAATYAEWRDYVLPKPDELAWTAIPWRSTLWTGVGDAHEARRPIVLWAMNGHPQGCT